LRQIEAENELIARLQRRRPRVEEVDLVTLDADVLFRRTLFKVLALASGRVRQDASDEERDPAPGPAPAPQRHEARIQGRVAMRRLR